MAKPGKNGGNKNGGKKNGNGNGKPPKPAEAAAPAPAATKAAQPVKLPASAMAAAQHNRFAEDFSQIVAVLMRAPNYRNLAIANLEWLVIPPLIAGQSRVAVSKLKVDGPVIPVAVALWARVSPSVDKRLSEKLDEAPMLRAAEWTSGDILWMIALVGEPDALAKLLPQVQKTVFKGRPVKLRVQQADGTTIVKTLGATVAGTR